MKIMIVDDNSEMRTLIRSLLKDVAQEFVECAGGEEAVARFATERPDWTLMDVVMPGVDGPLRHAGLRRSSRWPVSWS